MKVKITMILMTLCLSVGFVLTRAHSATNVEKIAFVSNRNGNSEIYVMNVDGTNQTNLTNNSAGEDNPPWIIQIDSDSDGVPDGYDNCPANANADQLDTDHDGIGNVCDTDDDNDGVPDNMDTFPTDPNESVDTDGDGVGNNADIDDDNDGQSDVDETACGSNPLDATSVSSDNDADHIPECVDTEDDNDSVPDTADNCPLTVDPDQADFDRDGIGDVCDPHTGPPRDKEQCKNNSFTRFDVPRRFKNQGDCIQFVNTGK